MVAIKTTIERMPSDCDFCQWFGTSPHPYKGWTDICELMGHSMDDDQPEEWIYSGDGRPKACPLVEIEDEPQTDYRIDGTIGYKCPKCGRGNFLKNEPNCVYCGEPLIKTDCAWKRGENDDSKRADK